LSKNIERFFKQTNKKRYGSFEVKKNHEAASILDEPARSLLDTSSRRDPGAFLPMPTSRMTSERFYGG